MGLMTRNASQAEVLVWYPASPRTPDTVTSVLAARPRGATSATRCEWPWLSARYRACPSDLARGWHGRRGRTWLTPGGDGHQLGPTLGLSSMTACLVGRCLMGAWRQAVSPASSSDASYW